MPKYILAESSLDNQNYFTSKNPRGYNVFTLSELRGVTGRTKRGELVTGQMQYPLFSLTPEERSEIMKSNAYVQAVVSSRMNRIASLEWTVNSKRKIEDEIIYPIQKAKQIYDEYQDLNDLKSLILKFRIKSYLKSHLPDLRDDLKNFDKALYRFRKEIMIDDGISNQEVIDWLSEPNMEDEFDDFVKKWVENYMIQGAAAIYKEFPENSYLENFYNLPGGTVYPLRSETVGKYVAYVQTIMTATPAIYFQDEICFSNYIPASRRSYGYVPLDALINKVAESMLFDSFAAERADGTKEPEKLIIFGDTRNPFGDLTGGELNLPMDISEQKRIEEKLNTARKGAIATMSGVGHPLVADISKADTFAAQSERQDKLLRDIALVFNMTNMEINLAGGEFTSGKETSETQQEIEDGKGTRPIIQKLSSIINKNIIPYRFKGSSKEFQFKKGLSDFDQVELDTRKANSGTYTKNEIRISRGDDPVFEEGADSLTDPNTDQGTEQNPMIVQNSRG